MFASGYLILLSALLPCINISPIVIIPTLPNNITSIKTILPPADSKGVSPQLSPTVPKAEKHSKRVFSNVSSSAASAALPRSVINNMNVEIITTNVPATRMLTALRALYVPILRLFTVYRRFCVFPTLLPKEVLP